MENSDKQKGKKKRSPVSSVGTPITHLVSVSQALVCACINMWGRLSHWKDLNPLPFSLSLALNGSFKKLPFCRYTQTDCGSCYRTCRLSCEIHALTELIGSSYLFLETSFLRYLCWQKSSWHLKIFDWLPPNSSKGIKCAECAAVLCSRCLMPSLTGAFPRFPRSQERRTLNSCSPCLCHLRRSGRRWLCIVVFDIHLPNCTGVSQCHT